MESHGQRPCRERRLMRLDLSCRWFATSLNFCFCCLFSELFPSPGIEGLCKGCALK